MMPVRIEYVLRRAELATVSPAIIVQLQHSLCRNDRAQVSGEYYVGTGGHDNRDGKAGQVNEILMSVYSC